MFLEKILDISRYSNKLVNTNIWGAMIPLYPQKVRCVDYNHSHIEYEEDYFMNIFREIGEAEEIKVFRQGVLTREKTLDEFVEFIKRVFEINQYFNLSLNKYQYIIQILNLNSRERMEDAEYIIIGIIDPDLSTQENMDMMRRELMRVTGFEPNYIYLPLHIYDNEEMSF